MSASSSAAMPYIGSKISLITNSELRYEGTLVNINTSNSTVTLQDVRMAGTENRKALQYVLPSSELFDYIVFNGKDIKDLTVSESGFSVKEDPAVVAVNVAPANVGYTTAANEMRHQQQQQQQQMRLPPPNSRRSPMDHRMGFMSNRYPPKRDYDYSMARGNKNLNVMGGGSGGNTIGTKAIVGELLAQPNSSLKSQVAQAFDFESHNAKFTKNDVEKELVGITAPVYDKNSSFFDNISCETLNRQRGRDSKIDRERQRELDTETFGPAAALTRGPRYYRRGGYNNRRGGIRNNRGGYGGVYGTGRPEYNSYNNAGGNYNNAGNRNAFHVHAN